MTSNVECRILNNGDRIFFVEDYNFFIDVPDIECLTNVQLLKYGRFFKIMGVLDRSYLLPQLGFALQRYIKPIMLFKISTDIIEYEVKKTYSKMEYRGLVAPLGARTLKVRAEEQRAFQKMSIITFSLNGNMEYQLVEDYIKDDE
jgi:hypothetical protein